MTVVEVSAWLDIGPSTAVVPDRGVRALVAGRPVAVFCCSSRSGGEWFAIDDGDPFTGASVLSRGLVGSVGERPMVASPLLKHRFDLATGVCLDDPSVAVDTFAVRVVDGRVEVATAPSCGGNQGETEAKHGPATIRP